MTTHILTIFRDLGVVFLFLSAWGFNEKVIRFFESPVMRSPVLAACISFLGLGFWRGIDYLIKRHRRRKAAQQAKEV